MSETGASERMPRAVVLCGGKGIRLRPLTNHFPKPLVEVRGRPIIDFIVNHLRKNSVSEIVLAGGYKWDLLRDYFVDSNIAVIDTGDVDIIQRIRMLDDGVEDELLVLYGDTLSDVNIHSLLRAHRISGCSATVTVWPLQSSFGLFSIGENNLITSYHEKPVLEHWINIGYFVFNREVLELLARFSKFEELIEYLVIAGGLNAYRHSGLHVTVNTRSELEEAEESLASWSSLDW